MWAEGHGGSLGGGHAAEGTSPSFQLTELPRILKTLLVARNNTQRSLPHASLTKKCVDSEKCSPDPQAEQRPRAEAFSFVFLALPSVKFTPFSGRLSRLWRQNGCGHMQLTFHNDELPPPLHSPRKEEFSLPSSSETILELILSDFDRVTPTAPNQPWCTSRGKHSS